MSTIKTEKFQPFIVLKNNLLTTLTITTQKWKKKSHWLSTQRDECRTKKNCAWYRKCVNYDGPREGRKKQIKHAHSLCFCGNKCTGSTLTNCILWQCKRHREIKAQFLQQQQFFFRKKKCENARHTNNMMQYFDTIWKWKSDYYLPNAKPSFVHCTCPAKFDTSQRRTASEPSNTCKSCGVTLNFCCWAALVCTTIIAIPEKNEEKKNCISVRMKEKKFFFCTRFAFLIKMHLIYDCRKSMHD